MSGQPALIGAPLFAPVLAAINYGLPQPRVFMRPYELFPLRAYLYGKGRITGTVKNTPGTPVRRLVRLHREIDGMFVKAVWSDPITGAYEFNGVRPDCKYTVTSYDHTQAYRAVIADRVTPDALP